jgi:hypothetical protein
MPFLTLNNDWSNLASFYNQNFTNKPEVPRIKYNSFDDGLIRGGVLNVGISTIRDTARIGKFYLTGRGASFLIKQVGLQLSNPKLEQPQNFKFLSNSNTRLYNLGVNTLAQVPINALGGHIIRHGILPVGGVGFLEGDSLNNIKGYNYESIVLDNNKSGKNRLIGYLDTLNNIPPEDTTPVLLQEYNGGAASVYGIGKTQIRTTNVISSGFIKKKKQRQQVIDLIKKSLFSRVRADLLTRDLTNPFTGETNTISESDRALADQLNSDATKLLNDATRIQNEIDEVNNRIADNDDFSIYKHPFYRLKNIQSRIGTSTSKFGPNNVKTKYNVDSINVIDVINSGVFYSGSLNPNSSIAKDGSILSKTVTGDTGISGFFGRDIIKFRIEFLNNDTPVTTTGTAPITITDINTDVLAFRAYLDDFNDGMSAKWNSFRYMGRGEEFYVYEGFTRDVSVAFTIFAHSPEEMRPIYRKLNYLLSSFAPDYSPALKMRGNIGYLTVGDYLYRQPGVFTDIKLSGMLDSNWEIALAEPEDDPNDKQQYELPKYIKVNLSFKPIHTFLPRKVQLDKYANSPFITLDKKAYPAQAGTIYNSDGSVKTAGVNKFLDQC